MTQNDAICEMPRLSHDRDKATPGQIAEEANVDLGPGMTGDSARQDTSRHPCPPKTSTQERGRDQQESDPERGNDALSRT